MEQEQRVYCLLYDWTGRMSHLQELRRRARARAPPAQHTHLHTPVSCHPQMLSAHIQPEWEAVQNCFLALAY